jgi:hypothetical protein
MMPGTAVDSYKFIDNKPLNQGNSSQIKYYKPVTNFVPKIIPTIPQNRYVSIPISYTPVVQ